MPTSLRRNATVRLPDEFWPSGQPGSWPDNELRAICWAAHDRLVQRRAANVCTEPRSWRDGPGRSIPLAPAIREE
jgi:hypothetical protein